MKFHEKILFFSKKRNYFKDIKLIAICHKKVVAYNIIKSK